MTLRGRQGPGRPASRLKDCTDAANRVCEEPENQKKGLERGNHLSRDELDGQKCLPVNEHGGTDEKGFEEGSHVGAVDA